MPHAGEACHCEAYNDEEASCRSGPVISSLGLTLGRYWALFVFNLPNAALLYLYHPPVQWLGLITCSFGSWISALPVRAGLPNVVAASSTAHEQRTLR